MDILSSLIYAVLSGAKIFSLTVQQQTNSVFIVLLRSISDSLVITCCYKRKAEQ